VNNTIIKTILLALVLLFFSKTLTMKIILEESLEKSKKCKLCSKEIRALVRLSCCDNFCHLDCKTKSNSALCPKCQILDEDGDGFELIKGEGSKTKESICPFCEKILEPIFIKSCCQYSLHKKCYTKYLSTKCPICEKKKPHMVDKSCQTMPFEPVKKQSVNTEKFINLLVKGLPNQICGMPLKRPNKENVEKKKFKKEEIKKVKNRLGIMPAITILVIAPVTFLFLHHFLK